MQIIKSIPEFFDEEKVPVYIHELRWKDEALTCPHCKSPRVGR